MSRYWYAAVVPGGDPRLSSTYQRITFNQGKPTCVEGTRVCAIYSPSGGLVPFSPLSGRMLGYVATALATLRPQPQGSKYYVYLKGILG